MENLITIAINVDNVNAIIPKNEMGKPDSLNIYVDVSKYKLEDLFCKIWETVGDDEFDKWVSKHRTDLNPGIY